MVTTFHQKLIHGMKLNKCVIICAMSKYIEIDQLTKDNVGSQIIADKCQKDKTEYHCRKIRNQMFWALNRQFGNDTPIMRSTEGHMTLVSGSDFWESSYHPFHLLGEFEYAGSVTTELTKYNEAIGRLKKMPIDQLAKVSGITVPPHLISDDYRDIRKVVSEAVEQALNN